jgi:hypothetical protein
MRGTLRHAVQVTVTTAIALSLGACAASLPQPEPAAPPAVALPVLSIAQSEGVLSRIGDVLATADAALDPAGLPERLTGPALAIRTAEYVRAKATDGAKPPTALPAQAQTLVVPDTTTWPRTELVVTQQPADLQAPRLLVLTQATARDPYRLWGWARLGAGVQMPATADTTHGSAPIAADATGLLVSPGETLAQYADVLANGDASKFAGAFPADFFRTYIETKRAAYSESLKAVATVTETYTPAGDGIVALATADGGAIVVGAMTTQTTIAVAQGSVALDDPFEAALAGRASVTKGSVRTWTDVVAFYVPPAGSTTTQIQVLAAEHSLTSVTGE